METQSLAGLTLLIAAAAFLYSSVGHAGASGYLAAMALFGLAPETMKPAALALNILVASIALVRFYQAGCFSWHLLWPFVAGAMPLAFLGGALPIGARAYKSIVGVVLLFAAVRMMLPAKTGPNAAPKPLPLIPALAWGGVIGFLSGLTGTGGGIFLSPLLLIAGWAETKQTGGVSAAFILCNSVAGLSGRVMAGTTFPPELALWALAAVLGGLAGSTVGSRKLQPARFRFALGIVLLIASLKLVFA